jgi:hypothetical protein
MEECENMAFSVAFPTALVSDGLCYIGKVRPDFKALGDNQYCLAYHFPDYVHVSEYVDE